MKAVLVVCLQMVMLVPPLVRAENEGEPVQRFVNATVEQSVQSLKMALDNPSQGIQVSAAQTVRQLKELLPEHEFSLLIIPLMHIVKDEDAGTPSRVVAALALHDLRSSRGDYAISRTAEFSTNKRVKHICSWLAYNRKREAVGGRTLGSLQPWNPLIQVMPEPVPEFVTQDK
jgi:hypothetical protein